jgi:thiamine-phosphate pyrophosphorylase
MKAIADCRLYAFIDTAYLQGRSPQDLGQALCESGADLIQIRAKACSKCEVRRLAEEVLPVVRKHNVGLVINDHLDVAMDVGADLCHLGQEDFFDAGYTHIKQLPIPQGRIRIGLSTHAPEQAKRAVLAGADYVAIGPIYATGTKPTAKPVTLEYVRWAAENITTPWFGIGGISLANLPDVVEAGATRICVVSAILNATDVAGECRKFRSRLGELLHEQATSNR